MAAQAKPTAKAGAIAFESDAGRWVLAVAVLGSGIVFLDGTVVNVALPTIGEDLGAGTSSLQWILNGYMLTLASLILLGGSLGDRRGRRLIFTIGVVWFSVASLLCALAPSSEALIVARLLQGVGGALLTPGSLAMIESTFRRGDRARAIGAWSGLTGVATAIGPLLGGWLVEAISWRLIFLINVPIGIFVALMASRHVPETRDTSASGRLDGPGALLAALALGGISYALIQAPDDGASAAVVLAAAASLVAGAAFIAVERRSANPMVPLSMFAAKQFSAANLVTFAVYAALSGVLFLLVAFLQISLGYTPLGAGAATLPVTLIMLAFSARSGALAQRIGPRIPLTLGPLVLAIGMLMMIAIDPGDPYVSGVLPAVFVFGAGLTLVVAPVTATVLAAAEARRSGIASGINNAVSRVAGLLAVAALPVIAGITGDRFYDPAAMADGFRIAMIVCAALSAAGGLTAWLMIDARVLASDPEPEPPHHDCAVAGAPLRPDHRDQPLEEVSGEG